MQLYAFQEHQKNLAGMMNKMCCCDFKEHHHHDATPTSFWKSAECSEENKLAAVCLHAQVHTGQLVWECCALDFCFPSLSSLSLLPAGAIAARWDGSEGGCNLGPRPRLPTTSALIGSSSQLHIKSARGEKGVWGRGGGTATEHLKKIRLWYTGFTISFTSSNAYYTRKKKTLPIASIVSSLC